MKIKMKLFLLCAAVAPFLMMNSGLQNGSRFGCVCAFEKFPKSGIGSGENCSSSSHKNENAPAPALAFENDSSPECDRVPTEWCDRFHQNEKILEKYASKYNTPDCLYLDKMAFWFPEDDSIKRGKNQPESKAGNWLNFCFHSAVLEGLLATRNQNFESMERCIKKECQDFPFAELKKLTCSMWTQLKSNMLELNYFYRGLVYFMHCLDSKCFYNFICCLADVRSPYMQLFIACWMNWAYDLDTDVKWDELIDIMKNDPDRMDSKAGFNSILSCFHFDSKLNKALLNYYLRVLKQKDAYSADKRDYILFSLDYLSCLRCENGFNMPKAINWFAENYLRLRFGGFCWDRYNIKSVSFVID